jgi:DNA-directed RNA polymerase specialized sigma24 family protein
VTRTAPSRASDPAADRNWEAALRGDRAAFQAAITPHLKELFKAAQRELRYRIALGDLGAQDLEPGELVGEVLARGWRDRQHRPSHLSLRTWLLTLLFRVTEDIVRREARFKNLSSVSLEQPVPPEPTYDDDESFLEWYQPDELMRWEDVVDGTSMNPEEAAAADEEFTRAIEPRAREAFLMHDLHGVPLEEIAVAFDVSLSEAAQLLVEGRRLAGAAGSGETR